MRQTNVGNTQVNILAYPILNLPELSSHWYGLHLSFGFPSAAKGWFFSMAAETEFLLTRDEWLISQNYIERKTNGKAETRDASESACLADPLQNWSNEQLKRHQAGVLIMGCGPIGMLFAIALKRQFGNKLPVVLLENRIQSESCSMPFSRAWPINIPALQIAHFVDAPLPSTTYLPWNLNDLEQRLFTQAMSLGCRVLFSKRSHENLIAGLDPIVIIDATGGRLRGPAQAIRETYTQPLPTMTLQGVWDRTQFGMRTGSMGEAGANSISVAVFDNGYAQPLWNASPLSTWMIKITGISKACGEQILSFMQANNRDNWGFIWPTHSSDRQYLALLHLRSAEAIQLASCLVAPTSVEESSHRLGKSNDSRWSALLGILESDSATRQGALVHPPFLWAPRVCALEPSAWLCPDGRLVIPVGDSLFNGHPKVGNGLGAHIPMLCECIKHFG